MPLKPLEDNNQVTTWRGVEFWMADEAGSLVFCRIDPEALRDRAKRTHFEGADVKVFEVYQDLLEQVASDAFHADAINEAGCVIVTKGALDRVSRSGLGRRRLAGAGAKVQAPQGPFGGAIFTRCPQLITDHVLITLLSQTLRRSASRFAIARS
jgi:hypothetical protein